MGVSVEAHAVFGRELDGNDLSLVIRLYEEAVEYHADLADRRDAIRVAGGTVAADWEWEPEGYEICEEINRLPELRDLAKRLCGDPTAYVFQTHDDDRHFGGDTPPDTWIVGYDLHDFPSLEPSRQALWHEEFLKNAFWNTWVTGD